MHKYLYFRTFFVLQNICTQGFQLGEGGGGHHKHISMRDNLQHQNSSVWGKSKGQSYVHKSGAAGIIRSSRSCKHLHRFRRSLSMCVLEITYHYTYKTLIWHHSFRMISKLCLKSEEISENFTNKTRYVTYHLADMMATRNARRESWEKVSQHAPLKTPERNCGIIGRMRRSH